MIYDRRNNVTIEETITYFAEKIEKIGPEHHVLHQGGEKCRVYDR